METKERRKEIKRRVCGSFNPRLPRCFSVCQVFLSHLGWIHEYWENSLCQNHHLCYTFQTQARIEASDQDYEIQCFPRHVFFPLHTPKSKMFHFLLARLDEQEPEPLPYTPSIYQTSKY